MTDAPSVVRHWGNRIRFPRHSLLATPLQWVATLVVAIAMLPMAYLLWRARETIGSDHIDFLLTANTLRIIGNSILLTAAVAISASIISIPLAWLTTHSDLPGRQIWLVLGLLPLAIPSYLGAVTLTLALGPRGLLQGWLEPLGVSRLPEIYGFSGAWLSLTLFTFPYVLLPVRAAFLNMDPAMEEMARSLGSNRWRIFWRITFPLLRPSLAVGMLLTSLYTLSDFGAVSVMQFTTFTRAIYVQYGLPFFGRASAAFLSLILMVLALSLFVLERRISSRLQHFRDISGARRPSKTVQLGRWKYAALTFCTFIISLSVLIPIVVLISWLGRHKPAYALPLDLPTLTQNTLGVAALTACLAAIAALPVAYLVIRSPSQWNRVLYRLAFLPNALPGIVIALSLIFFSTRHLLSIYQTLPLLLLGYGIRFMPLSLGSTRSALASVNLRYEEAARGLGAIPLRALWRITLPLARSGILAGMALVFLNVVKELPTTLLLSPTGFQTYATYIWNSYDEAIFSQIALPGLILIALCALSLIPVFAWDRLLRKGNGHSL
ncbi:MAG: iron ABC transporter permease [Chloroflexi bacterium]|nr:iron ABC transporter permease [Chloroflexota bacterium]